VKNGKTSNPVNKKANGGVPKSSLAGKKVTPKNDSKKKKKRQYALMLCAPPQMRCH